MFAGFYQDHIFALLWCYNPQP